MQRWTPLPKYPLTPLLHKHVVSKYKRGQHLRLDIVSERLCDDILRVLSPTLQTRSPVDIVDLWPGAGLWSSKVNDLLQPRRHLLVEPPATRKYYKRFTEDLRRRKPECYEVLNDEPLALDTLPELLRRLVSIRKQQSGSDNGSVQRAEKNDTLVVLASPFFLNSKKSHFTPARWWMNFLSACSQHSELHNYGRVQMLTFLPDNEANLILPRSVVRRGGPSLLTEAFSSRTFEVASSDVVGDWVYWNEWEMLVNSAARVSERAAENNVVIPPGRERPPYALMPMPHNHGRRSGVPYVPQVLHGRFHRLVEIMKAPKDGNPETARETEDRRTRAMSTLKSENARAYEAIELVKRQSTIEEISTYMSRKAADPNMDVKKLKAMDKNIDLKTSILHQTMSEVGYRAVMKYQQFIDARRATLHSGNFDDSVVLYYRRPFEPLLIKDEEIYPRENPASVIYFETDFDSPLLRRVRNLDPEERSALISYTETVLPALIKGSERKISDLLQILFPDNKNPNDLVRRIPSLAKSAIKRLKPDFEDLPKSVIPNVDYELSSDAEKSTTPPDPAASFQHNMDYDFGDARIRSLPVSTMLDVIFEYRKSPTSLPVMELTRTLGGSVTSAKAIGGIGERARR